MTVGTAPGVAYIEKPAIGARVVYYIRPRIGNQMLFGGTRAAKSRPTTENGRPRETGSGRQNTVRR